MSTYSFDSDTFIAAVKDSEISPFAQPLAEAVIAQGHALKHGHLPQWQAAIDQLPDSQPCAYRIVDGAVSISVKDPTDSDKADGPDKLANIEQALKQLMPWRKGPFQFGSIFIDTEWRSDLKWDRLEPHISDLAGRTVLDVGCGSGYHLWRIRESGASSVLGIEPSLLYVKQFEAVQHFIQDPGVQLLPLPMEALPASMHAFDTIFSMGVLYHRRNPIEHLEQLMAAIKPGGELVLETLVVAEWDEPEQEESDKAASETTAFKPSATKTPGSNALNSGGIPDSASTQEKHEPGFSAGDDIHSLKIEGRYANMRNIYEIPSPRLLCEWLEQAGFESPSIADIHPTSRSEQRTTHWMTSHSLAQALDPDDPSKTLEGYPRPLRAVVTAQAPKG